MRSKEVSGARYQVSGVRYQVLGFYWHLAPFRGLNDPPRHDRVRPNARVAFPNPKARFGASPDGAGADWLASVVPSGSEPAAAFPSYATLRPLPGSSASWQFLLGSIARIPSATQPICFPSL